MDDGLGADGHPREERAGRIFVGAVLSERVGAQTIIVRNVSRWGMGGRTRSQPLEPGESVTLSLGGESVKGEVRWVRKDSFGVRFDREIDPTRFKFAGKSWECVNPPLDTGHVFDRFRPSTDCRRPGVKPR
jgi:hypothetical protein